MLRWTAEANKQRLSLADWVLLRLDAMPAPRPESLRPESLPLPLNEERVRVIAREEIEARLSGGASPATPSPPKSRARKKPAAPRVSDETGGLAKKRKG